MTPEERQLLAGLFDRTRAASSQPRDREAEALIADAVREQPYAPYLLAQTVIVQEQALHASSDRLQQLEAQIRDLQQQAAAPQGGSFLSGLGGLFGGAPAPSTDSDSTKQLASFAKATLHPNIAARSSARGWPFSQVELAFLTNPDAGLTTPGMPIPTDAITPSSLSASRTRPEIAASFAG